MKENTLSSEASAIAQAMYQLADDIEEAHDDEKWRTVNKLKDSASDAVYYIAQVEGGGKAQSAEHDCINGRKTLMTLRTLYVFVSKRGMCKLDPELIVRIDKLVDQIDTERELSVEEFKRKIEVEMKPWHEKYRIWQQISKD